MKHAAAILATDEKEFRTTMVIRIGNDYFHLDRNGGERGAYQAQDRPSQAYTIDVTEARRLMLAMGIPPAEIAELTQETDQ